MVEHEARAGEENDGSTRRSILTTTGLSALLIGAGYWMVGTALANSVCAPESGNRHGWDAWSESTIYADGIYTATGQYGNGPSFITVAVTLTGGIITDVSVTPRATDPTSLDLQRRFAAAVPDVVVGKPLGQVKVDRLAGSSGTPKGFNAAIQRIRAQAAR